MIDSDNVLLLRPVSARSGFPAPGTARPPAGHTESPTSHVLATIYYRDAGKDPAAATFNVDSMRKDLRTMLEEARALGRELPVTQRALECFDRAARNGLGAADAATLPASWLRSQAK